VRGADDVLAALGPLAEAAQAEVTVPTEKPRLLAKTVAPPKAAAAAKPARSLRDTNALHQKILDRLGPSPLAEDQLIRDLALSAGEVGPQLVSLELDGRIARQPGGLIARL
jgi:DNA processing protein